MGTFYNYSRMIHYRMLFFMGVFMVLWLWCCPADLMAFLKILEHVPKISFFQISEISSEIFKNRKLQGNYSFWNIFFTLWVFKFLMAHHLLTTILVKQQFRLHHATSCLLEASRGFLPTSWVWSYIWSGTSIQGSIWSLRKRFHPNPWFGKCVSWCNWVTYMGF